MVPKGCRTPAPSWDNNKGPTLYHCHAKQLRLAQKAVLEEQEVTAYWETAAPLGLSFLI